MAERRQEEGRIVPDHELGTGGDQDIVRGPLASDDTRFVRVGTADDPFTADRLTAALEDAGIPVVARAQRDHLLDPLVNPHRAFWVVLTPEERAAEARAIVDRCHAEMRARAAELERAAEEEELASEESDVTIR